MREKEKNQDLVKICCSLKKHRKESLNCCHSGLDLTGKTELMGEGDMSEGVVIFKGIV